MPRLLAGDVYIKTRSRYFIYQGKLTVSKGKSPGFLYCVICQPYSFHIWTVSRRDVFPRPYCEDLLYYRPARGTTPRVRKPGVKESAAVLPGSSLSLPTNNMEIGTLGILHTNVLANFEINSTHAQR